MRMDCPLKSFFAFFSFLAITMLKTSSPKEMKKQITTQKAAAKKRVAMKTNSKPTLVPLVDSLSLYLGKQKKTDKPKQMRRIPPNEEKYMIWDFLLIVSSFKSPVSAWVISAAETFFLKDWNQIRLRAPTKIVVKKKNRNRNANVVACKAVRKNPEYKIKKTKARRREMLKT